MHRWIFLCLSFLLPCLAGEVVHAAPPNIVFILADDLGCHDLGCYGSKFYETPNLDRMANDGLRFTNAYAACQVCSPTRAAIMTGKYPARLQLTNFLKGVRQPEDSPLLTAIYRDALPPQETTVAEALKSAGYVSGMFGKWHLGGKQSAPESQGFEVAQETPASGRPRGEKRGKPDKQDQWLTDRAIEFIEQRRDQPFFCYLAYHTVHIPLEADPKLIQKYEEKPRRAGEIQTNPIYAAMIEEMDSHVGRLLTGLDELKLSENSIVIFTSDNGGLSVVEGPNTPATSNAPLREGKGYMNEGGIRVPLIVRWPAGIKADTTCHTPVCSIDWMPTFQELAHADVRLPDVDGISLVPLLKGEELPARDLYWHYPHFANQGGRPAAAIRSGKWKLIEFYETGKLELYDLAADPGETTDVADNHQSLTEDLHRRLDTWRKQVNANMPKRRDEGD